MCGWGVVREIIVNVVVALTQGRESVETAGNRPSDHDRTEQGRVSGLQVQVTASQLWPNGVKIPCQAMRQSRLGMLAMALGY